MGIVVAPTHLDVDPVLLSGRVVHHIARVGQQGRAGHVPLVRGEEEDVGAGRVHLVRFTRMDRFLLHRFNLQSVQLLIKDLTKIHDDRLVDLLPQVSTEDLNQRDLQRRNLAVHENARQIQLDLETDVDVGSVDGRRPPEGEATVGNLIQTRPLGVGQLLVLHRLFETGGLLPKETFPRREVGPLEERVLQDAFDTSQRLDHVGTVVVEVPQFAVVALVGPPEGILLQHLVLFEFRADAPSFIVGQSVSILLEERVDARNTAIPAVFQVFQCQTAVLSRRLPDVSARTRPRLAANR